MDRERLIDEWRGKVSRVAPLDRVQLLLRFGLREDEIIEADDFCVLFSFMLAGRLFDRESILAWAHLPSQELGGRAPLEAVNARDFEDALLAAEKLVGPLTLPPTSSGLGPIERIERQEVWFAGPAPRLSE